MRFSFASNTVTAVPSTGSGVVDAIIVASVTGQRVAIGNRGAVPVAGLPPPPATVYRMSMDREGARLLMNSRLVFDQITLAQQASLPTTTLAGVLSRAGNRAYTFDADGKIHTFDLSVVQMSGIYPEIGTGITPLGNPGAGTGGADMLMTISPDGRTLFLAGATQIVVQPLP